MQKRLAIGKGKQQNGKDKNGKTLDFFLRGGIFYQKNDESFLKQMVFMGF